MTPRAKPRPPRRLNRTHPATTRSPLPQPRAVILVLRGLLAGVDEVGRGALAGPVSVGIAVVDLQEHGLLADVKDSKLLKAEDRERLEPAGSEPGAWPPPSGTPVARKSMTSASSPRPGLPVPGLARDPGPGITPDVVLLDGSHNWLSPAVQPHCSTTSRTPVCDAPVHTLVKADMQLPQRRRCECPGQGRARPDHAAAPPRNSRTSAGTSTRATALLLTGMRSAPAVQVSTTGQLEPATE
jgi:hypothetical protein